MLARGLGTHYNSKIMKNHTFKNSMSWDSNALDNFFFFIRKFWYNDTSKFASFGLDNLC